MQTSQGYIIRILQHFATKLWNITNFVMLFQAVMNFLSRLVGIKILSITQMVNWPLLKVEIAPAFAKTAPTKAETALTLEGPNYPLGAALL